MTYVDKNYRNEDLGWNGLNLTCHGLETGLKLVLDDKYENMYRIVRHPDFRSKNFYNLVNARENARTFFLAHMNSDIDDINEIRVA